jgi:quercetin dioxygenase-like cupin family protein
MRINFQRAFWTLSLATGFLGAAVSGQEPEALPLDAEPHHHLALKNEYVKVYQVEVAPHDAVKLHRHDTDAISLSLSDSLVTIHFPGKTDVQQKIANGQIRLQARGYVHSTAVDGDTPFRNDTVELLMPQTEKRNRCAQVMANQPLHCAGLGAQNGANFGEPQFETDQTYVGLVRVAPHERAVIGEPGRATLIVALDGGATHAGENGATGSLRAGDLVWLDRGTAGVVFRNDSGTEVRFIAFTFKASLAGESGPTK